MTIALAVLAFILLLAVAGWISSMESQEQKPLTPSDLNAMSDQERMDHIERWR